MILMLNNTVKAYSVPLPWHCTWTKSYVLCELVKLFNFNINFESFFLFLNGSKTEYPKLLMLQIFFLNLYFTATTLKFHTYSFLGYKVNDSLRFLFSYGFFSWFFFSQNFVHAISQILLAHYILSHFAQMIGRDQNFLDVLCCHFQYRFISLIFETFYDPLCAAVNWKTIIYESFF